MSKGLDINVPKSCRLPVRICAYIGIGPKVRTFCPRRTNLSAKTYIPFGTKVYRISRNIVGIVKSVHILWRVYLSEAREYGITPILSLRYA